MTTMLTFYGSPQGKHCDGLTRRAFLKVGALGVGGLTLADLLRLKAHAAGAASSKAVSNKAVIMVYLNGGPSHVDMYDLKPQAPVEYRGEFAPIETNVPGMAICELMPLQAKIADKLAIVRNIKFLQQGHTPPELFTGFLTGNRPAMGSVISKLRREAGVMGALPPYVYIGDANYVGQPSYLGKAHEAYIPGSRAMNLELSREMNQERLSDRRELLRAFDRVSRDLDDIRGSMAGLEAFTDQALAMVTTNRARDAFDISREPEKVREKYGKGKEFLQARRLVEAGVPFVTITPQNHGVPPKCNGQWDHHDHIFTCLRAVLPQLDQSIYALLTDLAERGLDKDVAVVVWGEMGRTPRVGHAARHGRGPRPLAAVGLRPARRRWAAVGPVDRGNRCPRRAARRRTLHAPKRAGHAVPRARHRPGHHLLRPPRPANVLARRLPPGQRTGVSMVAELATVQVRCRRSYGS
jgi:hypothetical protein